MGPVSAVRDCLRELTWDQTDKERNIICKRGEKALDELEAENAELRQKVSDAEWKEANCLEWRQTTGRWMVLSAPNDEGVRHCVEIRATQWGALSAARKAAT